MKLRVGPLDIAAVAVVLVVLFLPPRGLTVDSAYARVPDGERARVELGIAAAQARLLRDPADGAAAQDLAEILNDRSVGQPDQARRVAGEAASHVASPTRWRALLALSWAHAERLEIRLAKDVADQALAACEASPASCPTHERSRVEFYRDELAAGVDAIARGIDPRTDPAGFRRELLRAHPTSTFRPVRIQ